MKTSLVISLILVSFCFSCKTNTYKQAARQEKRDIRQAFKRQGEDSAFFYHIVQVNRRGYPISPYTKVPFKRRGFLIKQINYLENTEYFKNTYLSRLVAEIKKENQVLEKSGSLYADTINLMLYSHGGLASKNSSIKEAFEKYVKIRQSNPHTFPIFINWSSGLFSSYFQYATVARNGYFAKPTFFTALNLPLFTSVDLASSVLYAPKALNMFLFSKSESVWANNSIKNANSILADTLKPCCISKGCCIHSSTYDPANGKFIRGFNKGYDITGAFTGLPLSNLVASMGKPAWQNMTRRTKVMFRNTEQFSYKEIRNLTTQETKARRKIANSLEDYKNIDHSGPAALLAEELIKLAQTYPTKVFKISVFGHSMGTMVMNELFRLYGRSLPPNIYIDNIVYMAAACKIVDWENSIESYLRSSPKTHFYNLTLNPYREKQEKVGIPILELIVPSGSLLVWIDKMFEDPHSFTDRTLGKYDNFVMSYSIFDPLVRSRIHLKTFPYAPRKHKELKIPIRHGEVDDYHFWEEGYWK